MVDASYFSMLANNPRYFGGGVGFENTNPYSNYQSGRYPPTSYIGTPVDALGNPIAGPTTSTGSATPTSTPASVPGTTINSMPQQQAGQLRAVPNVLGLSPFQQGQMNAAPYEQAAYQAGQQGNGQRNVGSSDAIAAQQQAWLALAQQAYQQPYQQAQQQAAPQQQQATAPADTSYQDALSKLANPGRVTTGGYAWNPYTGQGGSGGGLGVPNTGNLPSRLWQYLTPTGLGGR